MNVGFIGVGSMGSMLIKALVTSGTLKAEQVVASNRSPEKLTRLSSALPGLRTGSNKDVAQCCQIIFLCIRPGDTPQVVSDIREDLSESHLLVVITNSLDIARVERVVKARVAKVIPSLTQSVGAGVSLVMYGSRVTDNDRHMLHYLLNRVSKPYVIEEHQARVASDLTSCGPAFLSFVYLSMARAAQACQPDLSPGAAQALVLHTVFATAKLLQESGFTLEDIVARVSTPGGVTAEGIKVLDEHLNSLWQQVIQTTIDKEAAKKVHIEL